MYSIEMLPATDAELEVYIIGIIFLTVLIFEEQHVAANEIYILYFSNVP